VTVSVSIVIPIYNSAPPLAKTLAALQHQTYPGHLTEVVIADDGSDDRPEAVVRRWTAELNAVVVAQQRCGFRLASARNLAIEAAEGDVIVSLDADMVPSPGLVAAHVAAVEPEVSMVSIGPRSYVDASHVSAEDLERDPAAISQARRIASASNWFLADDRRAAELSRLATHPAPYNCMHGCNCAYWRGRAREAGLHDEEFNGTWGYEDTEFAFRLWQKGGRFVFTPSAIAWHQENTLISFDERQHGDAVNFELACEKIPGFRDFKDRLRRRDRRPWW
jgi:chondroitin synthase